MNNKINRARRSNCNGPGSLCNKTSNFSFYDTDRLLIQYIEISSRKRLSPSTGKCKTKLLSVRFRRGLKLISRRVRGKAEIAYVKHPKSRSPGPGPREPHATTRSSIKMPTFFSRAFIYTRSAHSCRFATPSRDQQIAHTARIMLFDFPVS